MKIFMLSWWDFSQRWSHLIDSRIPNSKQCCSGVVMKNEQLRCIWKDEGLNVSKNCDCDTYFPGYPIGDTTWSRIMEFVHIG